MSEALTNGILVRVKSEYMADRSAPGAGRYAFAYTVQISNQGPETAQLRSRHWVITDATGEVQEVKGEGVVGAQPVLAPGETFEYTSWCVIATSTGAMRGSYQMVSARGKSFDAEVAEFRLAMPHSLN
ncbi:MAG TPA: Co2+/Mg2+ efflux protein ApaG [Polyangia bacterium]|jgi:ApaG protein|nr:Co2+/Mg2+ efflux protein ApaG [Polyangia bacterium]